VVSNLPPSESTPPDKPTPDEEAILPPAPRRLDPTLPLPTEMLENFGVTGRAQAPNQIDPPVARRPAEAPTAKIPVVPSAPPATPAGSVWQAGATPAQTPAAPAWQPPVADQPAWPEPPAWQAPAADPPTQAAPPGWQPPTADAPTPVTRPAPSAAPPVAQRPAPPAVTHRPPPAPPRPGPAPAQPASAAPILVQLGEVRVSSTTIHTPAGNIPLKGSRWAVSDQWHAQSKIPVWAVVCAILLFFVLCFLSLFFLLARQTKYTGTVQVTITNGAQQYVVRIPVADQRTVQYVNTQVNYVRSLAAL
jgi:hypothetical protein